MTFAIRCVTYIFYSQLLTNTGVELSEQYTSSPHGTPDHSFLSIESDEPEPTAETTVTSVAISTTVTTPVVMSAVMNSPDPTRVATPIQPRHLRDPATPPYMTNALLFNNATIYCIKVTTAELIEGLPQPLKLELWAHMLLFQNFAMFTGPGLTDVVIVNQETALLFFGRRSQNEGLMYTEAVGIISTFPQAMAFPSGTIDFAFEPITLTEGLRLSHSCRNTSPDPPQRDHPPTSLWRVPAHLSNSYNLARVLFGLRTHYIPPRRTEPIVPALYLATQGHLTQTHPHADLTAALHATLLSAVPVSTIQQGPIPNQVPNLEGNECRHSEPTLAPESNRPRPKQLRPVRLLCGQGEERIGYFPDLLEHNFVQESLQQSEQRIAENRAKRARTSLLEELECIQKSLLRINLKYTPMIGE